MNPSQLADELNRLRTEVEALRLANAALEQEMSNGAAQSVAMLQALEAKTNALREANQRQLHQSNFIQRVMDCSGALMIMLGPEGWIQQINRRCRQELHAHQNFEGHTLDDWLHPDERSSLQKNLPPLPWPVHSPLFETVRRASTYATEHWLLGKDGQYRPYWLEASVQYDPSGKEEGAVISATDISELKAQQECLRRSESLLREAQHIVQLGHWERDLKTGELICSDEFFQIYEIERGGEPSSDEIFLNRLHPEDQDRVDQAYQAALAGISAFDLEHRLLFEDGREKWVRGRTIAYYDASGLPLRILGTLQDVTSQHEVDAQQRLAASVFDNSLNAILITDPRGYIVKVNRAFTDVMGYAPEQVLGHKPSLFKSGQHDQHFYRQLWDCLKRDGKWQGEIWNRRHDGSLVPIWQNISAVRNKNGKVIRYISLFYDLSEQKQHAEHIHHLAYYDALTDLPNRQLFIERCEHVLERSRRESQAAAILFLDLDRFKQVNDNLGHPVGDELLREVAQRLRDTLRQCDTVARLGGDEFIILLENIGDLGVVKGVALKVLAALCQPYVLNGLKLDISTSIGISCYPLDGEDATTLIKHADLALYQAKENGRGNFRFFETHLTERARERLFLERELREAIGKGELTLVYQPQFALANQRLIGAEALLRWQHSERGPIPPDKFISIAEDCGLIVEIGEWVLRTACRQAKAWLDAGYSFGKIAVNLSGAQIERSNLLKTVAQTLQATGLPAQYLELEITETSIMRQTQQNIRSLEDLRALGVGLAIDDFGTGYSSLSYLKQLPVNKLKIDRSFVMDIPHDVNDIAITRAILALGQSLRLTVIAEGVETHDQVTFLKELACEEAQGYFFSKPLSPRDFLTLLQANQNAA